MPWIVITGHVGGANALCGSHAVGYPGMPAFNGMAAVIAREVAKASGGTGAVSRFAVLHHAGRLRAVGKYRNRLTHKRAVHDGPDRAPRDFFATPTRVEPQVDLDLSLLIETDVPDAFAARCAEAVRGREPHPVLDLLPVRSLGGRLEATAARIADTFEEAARAAPPGWLLCDHTDELEGARDVVDAFGFLTAKPETVRAAAVARATRQGNDMGATVDDETLALISARADAEGAMAGRIPMHVGWVSVSEGMPRRGARDPTAEHHFAESVTGLARFVRRHDALTGEPWRAAWVPTIDRGRGLFVARAVRP